MNRSLISVYRTESGGIPPHSKTLSRDLMGQLALAALVCITYLSCFSAAADNRPLSGSPIFPQPKPQRRRSTNRFFSFFHGSDWCPPCVEMQHQVIDSPAFAEYAKRALVLVDVDFPEKTKQSEELRRTNLALKTKIQP